jgi:formylglycine-generating enzyme required for sulfatase activity
MVLLPLGYCIDRTEVTQAEYKYWLDKAPTPTAENQIAECSLNKKFTPDCSASNPTSPTLWPPTLSMLDHPVVCVDWCDAYAYCAGMGKRLCGNIHGGSLGINDFQDASISQWYAACTSGGIFPPTSFPYGSLYQPNYCNDGTQASVAVGSKPLCQSTIPGYTGVYDLSGNVAEWEDACGGPETSAACRIRGGAYWHLEELDDGLACGSPDYYGRADAYDSLGFRCCYP